MLFTGQYEHVIDAKNRLAIPAEVRSRWQPKRDGDAWYAMPWPGGVLRLYTENRFETLAADMSLTLTPEEDEAALQVNLFGMSRRLEMDAAGRIRLPEEILALVGLSGEVVLVGAGDRLEVHDRNTWRGAMKERLERLPELIARCAAKKRGG